MANWLIVDDGSSDETRTEQWATMARSVARGRAGLTGLRVAKSGQGPPTKPFAQRGLDPRALVCPERVDSDRSSVVRSNGRRA